jgi:DeoR/GlpR family transcriptional regulator of sugar metabolism
MLAAQRRAVILSELDRDGTVRVSDLVQILGVSDMTVRRDLGVLERQGLLDKVHGGAMVRAEPSTSEPGFEANSARQRAEKEAIAARAASLVQAGSAIAISA